MDQIKAAALPKLSDVTFTGGLFKRIYDNTRDNVIPYMWDILNDAPGIEAAPMFVGLEETYPSHCIANFKVAAGEEDGHFYGMPFQDTDLAKWLEAVAYFLARNKNETLQAQADWAIDLIAKAQEADGYLDTFFTLTAPDKKFTNLAECHELYCAGHMMEAAVAYYKATGKRKLVDVMLRMAHLIDSKLGREAGKLPGYPGHEEIELALVKMYEVTGEEFLLNLAKYFIDERGQSPRYFEVELARNGGKAFFDALTRGGMHAYGPAYFQTHLPIRKQKEFLGHAVRCMYMACGIVDVARETGDQTLLAAAKTLFENMRLRKMYVTGGIGSAVAGERFTAEYDLPNDSIYAETCASIGLVFFMRRMLQLEQDSKYADIMERALYNTCLASTSLDGKNYFYVNPLEVTPDIIHGNPGLSHVRPVRPQWFGCACCPPNLARMIAALGENIYCTTDDTVYLHLYIANETRLHVAGQDVRIAVETDYPNVLTAKVMPSAGKYAVALRIPDWSRDHFTLQVNGKDADYTMANGYAVIDTTWTDGDVISIAFHDVVMRVYANSNVKFDVGKVAIQYGPIVYCLEEADNGKNLPSLYLPRDAEFTKTWKPEKLGGIMEITAEGSRIPASDALYTYSPLPAQPATLTFIPYYVWANRGENEMTVWVHEK